MVNLTSLGVGAVGVVFGIVIGELLEDKRYKIIGSIISAIIGLLKTVMVTYPIWLSYIGFGLLIGFIISAIWEPKPCAACKNLLK